MYARFTSWNVVLAVGVAMGMGVPAWADINNGFQTDWMYTTDSGTGAVDQGLYAFDEATGLLTQTLQPSESNWVTLTFSGRGTSDARLFVAKRDTADLANVLITELAADGTVVKAADLKTINGGTSPHVGPVAVGNLRYSIFHDSLFLALNSNNTAGGPLIIHQIDLGLTSIAATYTGPISQAVADVPKIDIDGNSGRIYLASSRLVSIEGGVVAIDTPSGTMTTLLDGSTVTDASWSATGPSGVVYRNHNNPEDAETLIVMQGPANGQAAGPAPVLEFYLNQTDGTGNLVKRQDLFISRRFPSSGQLDEFTGTAMTARSVDQQQGQHNAGIDQYTPEDVHFRPAFDAAINAKFLNNGYLDVDSPGVLCSSVLPAGSRSVIASAGDPSTPLTFTLRNKGYSGPINITVGKVPADTAWLTINPPSIGPIAQGASTQTSVTVNPSGLSPGVYPVDVTFADDCTGAYTHHRTVTLTVTECGLEVIPDPGTYYTTLCNATYTRKFNVRNSSVGGTDLNYTVQEVDVNGAALDHAWLTLDKTSGGPLASGETDIVTVTIDQAAADESIGYLKFTPGCQAQIPSATRFVEIQTGWTLSNYVYTGGVDPFLPDSAGVGYTFGAQGTPFGEVVDDPAADNGKAWRMNKSQGQERGFFVFRNNDTTNPFYEFENGATIVGRLRVPASTGLGGLLGINRGGTTCPPAVASQIDWGGAGDLAGQVRDSVRQAQGYNATSADTGLRDEYVTLRLTSGNGPFGEPTVVVYVNEDPTPVLLIPDAGCGDPLFAPSFGRDIGFGITSTAGSGDVYFDWVVGTNAGMFAPGDEVNCLGHSILPGACCLPNGTCEFTNADTCASLAGEYQGPNTNCGDGLCGPDPFADNDEDGDVDSRDFAEFQRCIAEVGSGLDLLPGCERWDRNGDGFVDNTIVQSVSDLGAFLQCSSGPDVPADVCCDGGAGCP